jgi:hypothetical protein
MRTPEDEKEDDEYLEWAKKRALAYLDEHDPAQAFTSMLSDMTKNPRFENHVGNRMGIGLMMVPGWISNPVEVRRWIEGYH